MPFNVTKFQKLKLKNYLINADIKEYTTFKIGGKCLAFVFINNVKELKKVLKFCIKYRVKYFVLGCGSNVLVGDKGFNGIIISLTSNFKSIVAKNKNNYIELNVGAGIKLNNINKYCAQNGYSGLEWSFGIPASIGGAIYMNAGSFEKCMANIVKRVKVIYISKFLWFNCLKTKNLTNKQCEFSYRNSIFKSKKYVIISALINLKKDVPLNVKFKMQECFNLKKQYQPLGTKNAGCVFKNGENYKIAKIIDMLNLKGKTIGFAQVSTKHSNFIINKSKASCQNVKDLINYIQSKVQKEFGFKPELEIELIEEGGIK